MSNKTISINPSLFHLGKSKSKTRKAREKKPLPIISPNVLKNKLMKRIKEHKQRETQEDKKTAKPSFQVNVRPSTSTTSSAYVNEEDEFGDSLQYLQTLAKQKQQTQQKEALERRTLRHRPSPPPTYNSSIPSLDVQLDLPDELRDTPPVNEPPMTLQVPYGVLKGGTKPCYREWMRTQRHRQEVTNPNASVLVGASHREQRLQQLKEKIKRKEQELRNHVPVSAPTPVPTYAPAVSSSAPSAMVNVPPIHVSTPQREAMPFVAPHSPKYEQPPQPPSDGVVVATKYITKKTIKKKYTLGRSRLQKKVGVLIKDRGTRKQVLAAQKELKRKNIQEVKTYLREHNLVKVGSSAPNDVLRKMYESAMLSGEITNKNSDILLHNFSKEDKEL